MKRSSGKLVEELRLIPEGENILWDSDFMNYPEKANPQRQKTEWRCQRLGKGRRGG